MRGLFKREWRRKTKTNLLVDFPLFGLELLINSKIFLVHTGVLLLLGLNVSLRAVLFAGGNVGSVCLPCVFLLFASGQKRD